MNQSMIFFIRDIPSLYTSYLHIWKKAVLPSAIHSQSLFAILRDPQLYNSRTFHTSYVPKKCAGSAEATIQIVQLDTLTQDEKNNTLAEFSLKGSFAIVNFYWEGFPWCEFVRQASLSRLASLTQGTAQLIAWAYISPQWLTEP